MRRSRKKEVPSEHRLYLYNYYYHVLYLKEMVGANGFESSTSWSRTSG